MCWVCNMRATGEGAFSFQQIMFRAKTERYHLSEIQRAILWAAYSGNRMEDFNNFLVDWKLARVRNVHKHVPGDHYHVDDVKFDTFKEAKEHIEREGNVFGELQLKHVYKRGGD